MALKETALAFPHLEQMCPNWLTICKSHMGRMHCLQQTASGSGYPGPSARGAWVGMLGGLASHTNMATREGIFTGLEDSWKNLNCLPPP